MCVRTKRPDDEKSALSHARPPLDGSNYAACTMIG